MFKILKNIVVFALKVLVIAYIFALLEEVLNKIIFWIMDNIKGVSHFERENKKMEQYFKVHGVQCQVCKKWYPLSFNTCPLCKEPMYLINTVQRRLELTDDRDI